MVKTALYRWNGEVKEEDIKKIEKLIKENNLDFLSPFLFMTHKYLNNLIKTLNRVVKC